MKRKRITKAANIDLHVSSTGNVGMEDNKQLTSERGQLSGSSAKTKNEP